MVPSYISLEAQIAFSDYAMDGFPRNPSSFPSGQQIYFLLKYFRPDLAPASFPLNGTHSPLVKRPKHEADHLPMLSKMGSNHYGVVHTDALVVRDRWSQIQNNL